MFSICSHLGTFARCVLYYNTILARGTCRPRCIPLHTGAFRHRTFLRRTGELGRSPMNRRRLKLRRRQATPSGALPAPVTPAGSRGGSLRAAPRVPMTKRTSLPCGTLDQGGYLRAPPCIPHDQPCGLDAPNLVAVGWRPACFRFLPTWRVVSTAGETSAFPHAGPCPHRGRGHSCPGILESTAQHAKPHRGRGIADLTHWCRSAITGVVHSTPMGDF